MCAGFHFFQVRGSKTYEFPIVIVATNGDEQFKGEELPMYMQEKHIQPALDLRKQPKLIQEKGNFQEFSK